MKPRYAIAAAGLLFAAGGSAGATEMFASHIEAFAQSAQADGEPVAIERSNPDLALGDPISGARPNIDFVTLGLGGSLVLSFDEPFATSLRIYETTWGDRAAWPESAAVSVGVGPSANEATWYDVTNFLNTDPVAEGAPISLEPVHILSGSTQFDFVRITDTTAQLEAGISYEGIDVNSVATERVPEPASIALLSLGLLAFRRR
jgi:hypothetical protein